MQNMNTTGEEEDVYLKVEVCMFILPSANWPSSFQLFPFQHHWFNCLTWTDQTKSHKISNTHTQIEWSSPLKLQADCRDTLSINDKRSEITAMVTGLIYSHVSLWYSQVEIAEDLQFAVWAAHISAPDRGIHLRRRQGGLQVRLHIPLLQLETAVKTPKYCMFGDMVASRYETKLSKSDSCTAR